MTAPLMAMALITIVAGEIDGTLAAEKVAAARNPDALVKLAVRAEANGMKGERDRLLREAVATDPDNLAARGLLGEILHEGAWLAADKVAEKIRSDAGAAGKRAEYEARRARLGDLAGEELLRARHLEEDGLHEDARVARAYADRKLAPGHVELGMWCEKNGLGPEALAHFTAAVRLDPYREAAWKHLGYVRFEGRWMPKDRAQAARREASLQKRADASWEPQLHRLKAALADKSRRAAAESQLAEIDDPRAVPMIAKVFGAGNEADQSRAVRMLGRIDTPGSTGELSALAVRSDFGDLRFEAGERLRGREPRDYAETLVNLIRKPWTYQYQPVQGPGTKGALAVDSTRFRLLRTYDAPPAFHLGATFRGYVGLGPDGLPIVISGAQLSASRTNLVNASWSQPIVRAAEQRTAQLIADAQIKAEVAQAQLASDVQDIELNNAEAAIQNQRIASVLKQTLDAPALGDDEDSWLGWWNDRAGYRYTPPPKVTITQEYQSLPPPSIQSCFAAGTPVNTRDGHRPIQALNVGDQVLCQDTTTGRLSFQPILGVHHNPPDRTVRVILDDGDEVVASLFHRFWIAGRGWVMARDLKAGEAVRTLGGRSRVLKIEAGPHLPVFNLDIAESHTFFVGLRDALVHDNTPPDPHAKPFDGIAEPATRRRAP